MPQVYYNLETEPETSLSQIFSNMKSNFEIAFPHYEGLFTQFMLRVTQLALEMASTHGEQSEDILSNLTFICVSIFSIGAQIFLVEIGDDFVKTAHLNAEQWLICVALAFIGSILGMLMRFIPVKEDPASFFDNSEEMSVASPVKAKKEIELVSNEEKT
jgi:hypothetical protein